MKMSPRPEQPGSDLPDHFSRNEPGVFAPLRDTLLTHGDHYMHLADLTSYCEAQEKLGALYADPGGWAHKSCNVSIVIDSFAASGFEDRRRQVELAGDGEAGGVWDVGDDDRDFDALQAAIANGFDNGSEI